MNSEFTKSLFEKSIFCHFDPPTDGEKSQKITQFWYTNTYVTKTPS